MLQAGQDTAQVGSRSWQEECKNYCSEVFTETPKWETCVRVRVPTRSLQGNAGSCENQAKLQGEARDFGEVGNLDPLPRKAAGASQPRSAASWATNERTTPRLLMVLETGLQDLSVSSLLWSNSSLIFPCSSSWNGMLNLCSHVLQV